ncbi:hypothetical protein BUALT_Bualt10G0063400 [Buddleja alternifolia]|uniref:Serine aminopeptidase S33 domain-containing protein n=1 Tax=Buddleja alternifolia TaxID=168488 RepID=A0AAV6WY87_9LAMI|nr:hypothetical protein BUALT_Bualt10G0063400 [Buddleja alternifolia]
MITNGTCFNSSPLILLNQYHKPYYTISVEIPTNSKFLRYLPEKSRTKSICLSMHREKKNVEVEHELRPLWDDGYGTRTVKDYLDAAKNMIQSDGGPPRWFCPVESGPPLKDSPLLLFLPGIDGLGMGLILHHKALGKVFEVRCLNVPVHDRTPYEGLVKFVESAVRAEHASFPDKPIYLVAESFGGCLALSVAASNPTIDLVLILVNPATSFNRSQLQPLFPLLEAFPEEFQYILPYLFGTLLGDPIKMANVINTKNPSTSPTKQLEKLIHELSSLITRASSLTDIFPKNTLIWKLKLLKAAAAISNSHLHNVKAETLILASGKDSILPSTLEAQRLSNLLKNCNVRIFHDNGHTLLMEDGINLLSVIKGTCIYRRSKRRDFVRDFLPPSKSEFDSMFDGRLGLFRVATCPVMLSTLPNGEIVRGLKGIPDKGPVLLVGYHMLLGSEVTSLVEEFLREKNIMVHGIAHPEIFNQTTNGPLHDTSGFDVFKVFGTIPVTPTNLFKLLAKKSHVLLYPGGVREALHRKGEEYKLFWPNEPEFVRMATRFGATIVPFGVVGADDIVKLCLDYDDLMRIPLVRDIIKRKNQNAVKVRPGIKMEGEISNQDFYIPGLIPKLPGRFYFLFGKPVETKGREELLANKVNAKDFYMEIKSGVEKCLAYLIKKREEDPYRSLFERLFFRAVSAPVHQVPTFDP